MLLCLMDLPNPVHGMSSINLKVKEIVVDQNKIGRVLNTCPSYASKYFNTKAWLFLKFIHTFYVVSKMIFFLNNINTIYRPINGGFGQVFDLIYVVISRLFGKKIFIHHHSFQYLNKKTALFSLFVKVLPVTTIHIVLGDTMKSKLSALYGIQSDLIRVVSNSTFFEISEVHNQVKAVDQKVVIGHMSNLCIEKGLDSFLLMCISLQEKKFDFLPLLAGPIRDESSRQVLELQTKQIDNLVYKGPVYADEKQAFFSSLDAFVFMSEYENEAEPLVLYEAAQYGAKVYCTQRGCMQNVCDSLAGISFGADYKIEDLVERIITDSKREEFSLAAKQGRVKQYNDLVLKNKNDFEHLLKEMLA